MHSYEHQYRNSFILLLTAFIWGTGFVAQALGMESLSPFAYTWARSLIGGIFLLCLIPLLDRLRGTTRQQVSPWRNRTVWSGGIVLGTLLFVSESLQQFGLLTTSVGKAAFLTSLYVLFVPLAGFFIGRKTSLNVLIAAVIALAGVWLLSVSNESFSIAQGDLLVIACAASFTVHILAIDHYVALADSVRLSCVQFFTGSVLGAIMMSLFGPPTLEDIRAALWCILYSGILSNGIAYTLQIIGQKGVHPSIASIIMSLEAAFGALSGWLFMHQVLSPREIWGCTIMMCALILAQLPARWFDFRRCS